VGDRLVAVNGTDLTGSTLATAIRLLAEARSSRTRSVRLTIDFDVGTVDMLGGM
jgi:hypothetical protein